MMPTEKYYTHYVCYTNVDGPHKVYWKISERGAASRALCDYKYEGGPI